MSVHAPIRFNNLSLNYFSSRGELSSIYYSTIKSIPNGSFSIQICPNYERKLEIDCIRVQNIIGSLHEIVQKSDLTEGLTLPYKETQIISSRSFSLIDALDLPRCPLAQKSEVLICDKEDYDFFYAPKSLLDLKDLSAKTAAVASNFYHSMGFIQTPIESLCQFLDNFPTEAPSRTARLPSNTKLFIKEKTTQEERIRSKVKIGEGTYGKVCFLKYNERPYAFKKMKKVKGGTPDQIRSLFLHEIAIHQMIFSFEHIVKIEGCFDTQIFLEYAPKGVLLDLIHKKLHTPQKLKAYFSCIAKGLKEIHDRGFNFKDLKSNNVLIFSDDVAKICDLGFVRPSFNDIDDNVCQDIAAPEIFDANEQNPISAKADIWSFGVLLFEALSSGRLPLFPETRGDKRYLSFVASASKHSAPLEVDYLVGAISYRNIDFFKYLDPDLNFLKIAKRCLHFNPTRRPDADELIQLLEGIPLA